MVHRERKMFVSRSSKLNGLLSICSILPKKLVEGSFKSSGNLYTQVQGGVVVPLFDEANGLPGDLNLVGKLLLSEVFFNAR